MDVDRLSRVSLAEKTAGVRTANSGRSVVLAFIGFPGHFDVRVVSSDSAYNRGTQFPDVAELEQFISQVSIYEGLDQTAVTSRVRTMLTKSPKPHNKVFL